MCVVHVPSIFCTLTQWENFNECLIQNHLHAYLAHEIIAIIFYCGFVNCIFVWFIWKCLLGAFSIRKASLVVCLCILCYSKIWRAHTLWILFIGLSDNKQNGFNMLSNTKKFILVERFTCNVSTKYTHAERTQPKCIVHEFYCSETFFIPFQRENEKDRIQFIYIWDVLWNI